MSEIQRLHVGPRFSECSVYAATVYLAGQVAADAANGIEEQTTEVLASVERLLAEAGSSKSRILMAQVFLADMSDYAGMNAVWDAWVVRGSAPSRATIQAQLARPEWKVEIVVTAAVA